jgi:two-component system NtrC family response regulator
LPSGEPRLLLVEDDQPQRKTLAGFLKKRGYVVVEAESAEQGLAMAAEQQVDLLLTDLRLGGPDGIELLQQIKNHHPDIQSLVLTAYGTVDDAVRAMKAGAYDFVSKPVDLDRLETLVEKALERVELAKDNRSLRQVVESSGIFSEFVGQSEAVQAVKEMTLKVAPSRASVLILGESGTGKEVLARAIHRASTRNDKPFLVVNCAAMPETLIESELFGYEKGAFTGAATKKAGRFEMANGGTLFLDEIGDIPLPLQVKLLNVIQSGSFERLGGTKTLKTDVRIIAATHRDLDKMIQEEKFRADLYYRLNVVSIALPPLRNRVADIPLLVEHFLRKHIDLSGSKVDGVDQDVVGRMQNWPFMGNVRELENWIERAVVLAEGNWLSKDDFPPQLFEEESAASAESQGGGLEPQVAGLEKSLITKALSNNKGNKSAAARELKITERAIRYKIKKYGI